MSGEDAKKVEGVYAEVLRRATSLTRDPEDAKDAVQEAYLALVERPPLNYRNPRAALHMIAHRKVIDLSRKRKPAIGDEFILEQIVAPQPDEELQGMISALHMAIGELPIDYRNVVKDKLGGLNYEEIASNYNISIQAARTRFCRATAYLKKKLIAYDLEKIEEKEPIRMPLPKSSVA